MSDESIEGGCLCGATRYRIAATPKWTAYCHCEDCQRAAGAPVVVWTAFPSGSLFFTKGEPKTFTWAARERTFCPECGSPLVFFDPAIPHEYEVTTCTLDDPSKHEPNSHTWVCDRQPWFDVRDKLPRHEVQP